MIKRISVNSHTIRRNLRAKEGSAMLPPISLHAGGETIRCYEVVVNGPSRVIYNQSKPLKCGARVWIETHSMVEIVGQGGTVREI